MKNKEQKNPFLKKELSEEAAGPLIKNIADPCECPGRDLAQLVTSTDGQIFFFFTYF